MVRVPTSNICGTHEFQAYIEIRVVHKAPITLRLKLRPSDLGASHSWAERKASRRRLSLRAVDPFCATDPQRPTGLSAVTHNCARARSFDIVVTTLPQYLARSLGGGHLTDCELDGGGKPVRYAAYRRRGLGPRCRLSDLCDCGVPHLPPAGLRSRCSQHPHKEPRFVRRDDRISKDVVFFPRAPWPRRRME